MKKWYIFAILLVIILFAIPMPKRSGFIEDTIMPPTSLTWKISDEHIECLPDNNLESKLHRSIENRSMNHGVSADKIKPYGFPLTTFVVATNCRGTFAHISLIAVLLNSMTGLVLAWAGSKLVKSRSKNN